MLGFKAHLVEDEVGIAQHDSSMRSQGYTRAGSVQHPESGKSIHVYRQGKGKKAQEIHAYVHHGVVAKTERHSGVADYSVLKKRLHESSILNAMGGSNIKQDPNRPKSAGEALARRAKLKADTAAFVKKDAEEQAAKLKKEDNRSPGQKGIDAERVTDTRSPGAQGIAAARKDDEERAKQVKKEDAEISEGWLFTSRHPKIGNKHATHRITYKHHPTGTKHKVDVTAPSDHHAVNHVHRHVLGGRSGGAPITIRNIRHLHESKTVFGRTDSYAAIHNETKKLTFKGSKKTVQKYIKAGEGKHTLAYTKKNVGDTWGGPVNEGLVSKIVNPIKQLNKLTKFKADRIADTLKKIGPYNATAPVGRALRKIHGNQEGGPKPLVTFGKKSTKPAEPMKKLAPMPDSFWEEKLDEGRFASVPKMAKHYAKQKWMASFEQHVTTKAPEHTGKIDWDTATHLHNRGKTPEEAAHTYHRINMKDEELEPKPGQKFLKELPKRGPDGKLIKSKAAQKVEGCIKMSGKKEKIDTSPILNNLTTAGTFNQ